MNFKRINCQEARDLLATNADKLQIIDIRDEESFANGHIKGARHIHNSNVQEFLNDAEFEQPLLVYCYHGNMSQSAAAYFAEQGFDQTYSLDGGFEAWDEP